MSLRRLALAWSLALVALAAGCQRARREGCDVGSGACSEERGAAVVRLELSPRPLRPLHEIDAAVALSSGGAPVDGAAVSVGLSMPGMYMGDNRASLAPVGNGRYGGKVVLLRCASGRRDWVADVVARLPGGPEVRARFPFEAAE